jgi:xylose dehydrogenase (NAD/NADP)
MSRLRRRLVEPNRNVISPSVARCKPSGKYPSASNAGIRDATARLYHKTFPSRPWLAFVSVKPLSFNISNMHDLEHRLTWGILGTGNIARQFATGVHASRRGKLIAVGSRTLEKAQAFGQAHHIPAALGSYQAILDDPTVQAVYNSLPNNLHHEWTIKALRAGKHVLCEKPFAINMAQAEEMFDVAHQQGKVLMEAFMYRTHPLTHAVQKAIRSGAIGEVRLIRTSFCFKVSKWQGNIRFNPDLAGGVIMDVGCYCVNFSRLFAGDEPNQIHVVHHRHESGIDDLAAGTLVFPSGAIAVFSCGMSAHADNTASICGSEGYIEIPVPWKPPASGATYTIARSTPPKMENPTIKTPPPRETRTITVDGDLYGLEADAFAATVQDGTPPAVSREDTLGNQRVMDELRRQMSLDS